MQSAEEFRTLIRECQNTGTCKRCVHLIEADRAAVALAAKLELIAEIHSLCSTNGWSCGTSVACVSAKYKP